MTNVLKYRYFLVILGAIVIGTGCSGDLNPDNPGALPTPDGGADAGGVISPNELFVTTVLDAVALKCGGCHGANGPYEPKFLGDTAETHYDALIVNYPNPYLGLSIVDSRLYTKGEAPHFGGQAPAFSPIELQAIDVWIQAEAETRTGQGEQQPEVEDPPLVDCPAGLNDAECAMVKFGTCFDYQLWNDLDVYEVSFNLSDQGSCRGCHSGLNPPGGFRANGDELDMYRAWKQSPGLYELVMPILDGGGQFLGLSNARRIERRGTEGGHPQYRLQGNYGGALRDFLNATFNAYEAGNCVDDPGGP